MAVIKKIVAHEIIDSRSIPTIEAWLELDNNKRVITSIPSGTSKGKNEAVEIRDNDHKRFDGQGVSQAVSYINELLAPKLIGTNPDKQFEIDNWLIKADSTANKSKLGANTTLAVSQLIAKAGAANQEKNLFAYLNSLFNQVHKEEVVVEKIPTPMFNIINGGKHANNDLQFQEYQIIPSSSQSFAQGYKVGVEIFQELKLILKYRNAGISVGEEGGLTSNFASNLDPFDIINEALIKKDLRPGLDIFLGTDIASSHFYKGDRYSLKDKPHALSADEYIKYLLNIVKTYSLLVMEDPIQEEDWGNWQKLNTLLPNNIYLVGDDLICTNKQRLLRAIKDKVCSGIIIKPNQIGTLTETFEVVSIAKKNNLATIVSHRSGETNDDFIADFAVGVQADFVKFGAPSRGERVAKYNRLWTIEREELVV